jgi:hypothetical protein
LEGQSGEEDRRVHIAEVVGGVDSGFVLVEFLYSDDFDRGQADEKQRASPCTGYGVLLATGFVPEATEQRDAAEGDGGQTNERDKEEVGEPAESERGTARSVEICRSFGRRISALILIQRCREGVLGHPCSAR